MMEKTYIAADVEAKHYARWEKSGSFACAPTSNKSPYTIMMPPPNVTGSLHMGHALTFTLQDVLVRYQRMIGKDTLWQPGTDHAGIATQMLVEKKIGAEEKKRRTDLGREEFLKRVWKWKEESGSTITRQLRRLGASPDWARERFTMDEGLNKAVNKVFVELYKQGLIYKDNRLVNWDPKLQTAISDLEVEPREIKGNLWHFKYPVDGTDTFIVVATTRPETMLGDSAVAVNPNDDRYKKLIGTFVKLPLVGRLIPIVGDDYADPETGSGAVKITPAHDFNDFEVGKRHNLPMINIMDRRGFLNNEVPEAYRGLERFEARKKVVADLEALGLLEKIEPHLHKVPHGDRSGVVIEPFLTEQWYCDAATLAKPALEAVETGKTEFVPKQWENTYFEWMRNIQPWCISRQLWWGHQIPAWYDESGKYYVAETEEDAQRQAGAGVKLTRDEDVLDTWFSSALWPFSTLGWPQQTPELNRYYPGDVLVTGFDIIFFWVARMMMMGMHFMKDVPFRKIYIHALVRDEKGQKMSKTKGNVIDPLDMIDKYGTDALRFTLTNLSTPGRDIKLATGRIESGRNFATKLWNAARFCEMNECKLDANFNPALVTLTLNKWVIGETAEAIRKTTAALNIYRYDDTATALYQFAWNIYCDWYLEFAKPVFMGSDEAAKAETRATAAWVLNTILHLLQPIMPYITEEIWQAFNNKPNEMLMLQEWPVAEGNWGSVDALAEVRWVIDAIGIIRSVRAELNVPAATNIQLIVQGADETVKHRLTAYKDFIFKMARVAGLTYDGTIPKDAAQAVLGNTTFVMPLAGVIDLDAERARIEKEHKKIFEEATRLEQKLGNPQFADFAPQDVVADHRERLEQARITLANLDAAKARLAG
ncbi:MAG: valine--tRNA ligase [Alphaproteobacteria bacterium]|nr:valine--tRNA ligase [Alphaproteobacteria bacterium]